MVVKADFHIHSCLSPCGDLAMSPRVIARVLRERGVGIAALTDHNAAFNCPAFRAACLREGVAPLFGIEAQSAEEAHLLCLFAGLDAALAFGKEVYDALPFVPNAPEKMGDQVYVNDDEEIIGEAEKYLVISAPWDVFTLAERARALGGLAIPAHADRAAFSLTSQLGAIPEGPWDAVELVRLDSRGEGFPDAPAVQGSDAHFPEHIARRHFLLDTGGEPLVTGAGDVRMEAVRRGLALLGKHCKSLG